MPSDERMVNASFNSCSERVCLFDQVRAATDGVPAGKQHEAFHRKLHRRKAPRKGQEACNIQGAGAMSQALPDQGQGKNLDLANLSNIRCGGTLSQILPDQGQGRSLGFIGKGTRIPSRFAVGDIESPTNGSSLNDNGEILNRGHLGFNGDV